MSNSVKRIKTVGQPPSTPKSPAVKPLPPTPKKVARLLIEPADGESLKAYLRIRPLSKEEIERGEESCLRSIEEKSVVIADANGSEAKFEFTKVFDEESEQSEIFEDVAVPVIDHFFRGGNSLIFAYGRTGAGKTHTMVGTPKKKGILLRLLDMIFEKLSGVSKKRKSIEDENTEVKKTTKDFGSDLAISISVCEIYNEKIQDLLDKGTQKVIREDNGRIIIKDLTECPLLTSKDAQEVIQRGLGKRTISSTSLNNDSSRSHTIVTFNLKGSYFSSSLAICDLAGSERTRLKEASTINASLMTFGRCLEAIRKQEKVPFRDSKLTTVLQPYFTSKSLLSAIINISPCSGDCKETIHVLEFSAVASEITTSSRVITRLNTPSKPIDVNLHIIERSNQLELECKKLTSILDEKEKEIQFWRQKTYDLENEVNQLQIIIDHFNEQENNNVDDQSIPLPMELDDRSIKEEEEEVAEVIEKEIEKPTVKPSTHEKKKGFFKKILQSPKSKKTPPKNNEVSNSNSSSPLSDRTNRKLSASLTIEDVLKGDFGLKKNTNAPVSTNSSTPQIAKRYLFK